MLFRSKVYCFGPTFRAEKSKTRRHLTEFWMVEPEIAYAQLDDVMELAENFISSIVGRVLDKRREELKVLERDISKLEGISAPFPRLQYDDAVKMLQQGHAEGALESRFEWGGDLGSPDETFISSKYDKPVMVHRYPAAVKAFYMEPDPQRPDLALCVDVLAPEGYGEIIGGSERISDHDVLLQRIRDHLGLVTVMSRGHGRVRGEDGAGANALQRVLQRLALAAQLGQTRHAREGRVALVQVEHGRLDAERLQRHHAAHPQQHLLAHAQLGLALVQALGQAPVARAVGLAIGVHQHRLHAAHTHDPQPRLHLPVADRHANVHAGVLQRHAEIGRAHV